MQIVLHGGVLLLMLATPFSRGRCQVRHVQPSALAKQCASDLDWAEGLAAAKKRAASTKKRILWYVPTIPRSPMDRKPEIDLYMRSGLFSDPDLRGLLEDFVLLRTRPSLRQAKNYELTPFRFIEPGFLILDAEGKLLDREDRLTTFSPEWLAWRIAGRDGLRRMRELQGPVFRSFFARLKAGKVEEAKVLLVGRVAESPRGRFLLAACEFLLGHHTKAKVMLRELAKDENAGPFRNRAAAEAEGFGPLLRGFWTWRELPKQAFAKGRGTMMPCRSRDLGFLRSRSIEFLLRMQDEDGGYRDSNYDFGGLDSLPNVYVAVTAIVGMALLGERQVEGHSVLPAVHSALRYCIDETHYATKDEDELLWARLYALQFLTRTLATGLPLPEDLPQAALRKRAADLIRAIFDRQRSDGSFRHEYFNPFATAALLHALREAQAEKLGTSVKGKRLDAALGSLMQARTMQGAFSYGQPRGRARARLESAAGRMPLCEGALFVFGKSSPGSLKRALDLSFEHQGLLEASRKYDDHAGPHRIGGFFYWFDQFGRRMAIDALGSKSPKLAGALEPKLHAQILAIPEIDGAFVDSHELGRSYGTAMALLCLRPAGAR